MDEAPIEAQAPEYGVTLDIDKERAEKLMVGDEITVILSGKIKSIREGSYSDKLSKKFSVEIGEPVISSMNMTPADYELKRMSS